MAFSVICISHTDGAGGRDVGRWVADRLGFRYVDEQLILEAARLARVDPAVVAAAEQKQSLMQRILDALTSANESLGTATLAAGLAVPVAPAPSIPRASRDDLRGMIRAAIHEVARAGDAVIVSHAASLALAGKSGVLRVLVTAPVEVRAARVARERGLSQEDAVEAVDEGDKGRREYIRTFYQLDEELPTHYDIVINTEELTMTQASELIVGVAR